MLTVDEINGLIPDSEPWGVFDSDGSSGGPLQVQKIDDPDWCEPYGDEADAWMVLWRHIHDGDEIGMATLYHLLHENPAEALRIIHWCAFGAELDLPDYDYKEAPWA